MAHIIFICSHFRMQGKFTTDCDGSVRHEKWQEPAGTLSMALTAYTHVVTQQGVASDPQTSKTKDVAMSTIRTLWTMA